MKLTVITEDQTEADKADPFLKMTQNALDGINRDDVPLIVKLKSLGLAFALACNSIELTETEFLALCKDCYEFSGKAKTLKPQ